MKHSTILRKKNRFVLLILVAATIFHTLINLLGLIDDGQLLTLSSILFCICIGILTYFKIDERLICILLAIGLNSFVVLINLYFNYTHHLVLFILLLFILAIYHSFWLNFAMMSISLIEFYFLLKFHYEPFSKFYNSTDMTIFFLIFIFLAVIGIIQSNYLNYRWKKVEKVAEEKQQELLSKEGYLHLFFENAKDSIAVFDLEGRVVAVNPAFEKLYGWRKEECIGNEIPLVPPENLAYANERLRHLLNGESFHLFETKDMKKDGTYFDAQVTLSPILDDEGKVIATSVITRDISYKKEAEQMRIQSEKLKVAGEIAAGVAHEIRNPLTVISGFVQMMNNEQNSPYTYYTNLINAEIDRINLIISEFLVLSKPHSKQVRDFDVKHVVSDILLLFKPELQMKNICLLEDIPDNNIVLRGDSNQIKQVLINLIKNAIEAIETDGTITISIKEAEEGYCAIRVADNGQGMSEEVIQHIFEPFYTTKDAGTGLGMMISEKIIQEHKGWIEINSRVGEGTEISIFLEMLSES